VGAAVCLLLAGCGGGANPDAATPSIAPSAIAVSTTTPGISSSATAVSTATPLKTAAPPPTCAPNPRLTLTAQPTAGGDDVVISARVEQAGCYAPDTQGMAIYSRAPGASALPVVMGVGGMEQGETEVSFVWSNGCGLVGPFEVQASFRGASASLTLDAGPRCDDPGSGAKSVLVHTNSGIRP
jgi:hypothetical protein